jgi:hypothetical protein
VGSSLRYLGCLVGFGFGAVWVSVGVASAFVCLLFAALGYGVVFMAERARAEASRRPAVLPLRAEAVPLDGPDLAADVADDATSPLTAEAEYGWPPSFVTAP